MVFRISAVGATTQGAAAAPAGDGRGIYVVKKGQGIYSIAKEFGMKPDEFQKWAGLKSTNLSVGQEIKLPTATVPDGKGIFALAKKYNMSIEDFCKINGITKSYQAKKGEKFYVKQGGLATSASSSASGSSSTSGISPSANDKTRVKLTKNGGTHTVSSLREGAIESGKKEANTKFQEYCRDNRIKYNPNLLDLSPINRYPNPVIDKNGNIVAAQSEFLKPTGKPNGKAVIINPGHGGYSSRTGYFDPGSFSFIKKGNGKYAPLLEYEKMVDYSEKLATKLRAEGYAVIIAGGHHQTMYDKGTMKNLISKISSGQFDGKKYSRANISMISLHADSSPGETGSGVVYYSQYSNDKNLATKMNTELNQDDWIVSKTVPKTGGVAVLGEATSSIPSVLLEVEYVNGTKSKNLDSANYRDKFIEATVDGLNSYYGIK